ncbi:MAG TPA: hypothetical protein VIB39_10100 [Candidatus Angelobacter sp.]|jgi:hypothetical protein
MKIDLRIERLVLEGLPVGAGDSRHIKAAVTAELTRLLSEGGISGELSGGGAAPNVPAPGFQLEQKAKPQQLGRQIARSVYGGIGRQK